jgi:hypothetical protein
MRKIGHFQLLFSKTDFIFVNFLYIQNETIMDNETDETKNPLLLLFVDTERTHTRQNQNSLFYWSIISCALFIISWNGGWWVYDSTIQLAKEDLIFGFLYLFPMVLLMMMSIAISLFTAGLTLIFWRRFTNNTKKIVTLFLSSGVLAYLLSMWIRVMQSYA